jgi:hypothetical protein
MLAKSVRKAARMILWLPSQTTIGLASASFNGTPNTKACGSRK